MIGSVKIPTFLNDGDAILLAAPARFASAAAIKDAASAISSAGFTPILPDNLSARDHQFGGSDHHRASILNSAFRDPTIRAVLSLRGGYGCGRILPLLDTQAYLADPTWIIGFSDITALHGWSSQLGIASLHAPVASTLASTHPPDTALLWSTLRGNSPTSIVGDAPNVGDAPVVGGNLSVLYSLLGTPYFPKIEGCWLLLEDLDEYLYHIDRMLLALRLAGIFGKVRGLLIGSFTDLRDNTTAFGQSSDNPFGRSLQDMIYEHVPEGLEVIYDIPVGHGYRNVPVILGASRVGI